MTNIDNNFKIISEEVYFVHYEVFNLILLLNKIANIDGNYFKAVLVSILFFSRS
jgi:hypothetical protein